MTLPLLKAKPVRLADFHAKLVDIPEDERWELIGGEVVKSMVGARWEHARIVGNLHFALRQRLDARKSPCRVFAETFRLEIGDETSLFPDIMVACVPLAPGAIALRNPTVLMEVLSDDAKRDRGVKWDAYRTIETLRHYVLVNRDAPTIETFDRNEGDWGARLIEGIDAALDLAALDLSIPLSEIYADLLA